VKFKFIAAGQVFLANSSDSQQLTAISDREASAAIVPPVRPAKSSLVPFVVAGLALAGALLGGYYLYTRLSTGAKTPGVGENNSASGGASGATGTSAPGTGSSSSGSGGGGSKNASERDTDILNQARRLSQTNIDQAHRDLATLADDSPVRATAEYKQIEAAWADAVIERAQREPDLATKTALLQSVVAAGSVDDERRAQARLLLEKSGTTAPTAGATASATGAPSAALTASASAVPAASAPTSAAAPHSSKPGAPGNSTAAPVSPRVSALEQAREAQGAGDFAKVKSLLQGRVSKANAGSEEGRMLRAACKAMHDAACLKSLE
jgi:hypothetical protein